jgi:hypothetical protein
MFCLTGEHRRSRMISVRVSEAEYIAMRAMSASYGARNISDFARLAVQRAISGSFGSDMAIAGTLRELGTRLNCLEERISLLAGRTDRS